LGQTHFDKVCGVNGVYVGAKGSEVSVPTVASVHVNLMPVTTGAASTFIVAPIAGTVSGYVAHSVSAGTGRVTTVTVGSAGDILCETAVTAANATIGVPVVLTNTSGTTTIAKGASMKVSTLSCGTAQVSIGVALTFTPTA